jgi:hypothetical protein
MKHESSINRKKTSLSPVSQKGGLAKSLTIFSECVAAFGASEELG